MSKNERHFVSFAEAVLLRPKMYTLGGTYEEAMAFLEGYFSGMAKENPYAAPVCEWVSFQRWLAEQLAVPTSDALSKLKSTYPSSQDALSGMLEWLSRFRAECAERDHLTTRT